MKIKVRTTVGVCEACLEGKQTRQSSHRPATRATGTSRTYSQRSVWANRPNNLRRDKLLRPIHRRFYKDDAYLSSEEENIGRGAGEVQRVQTRSRKADWKINQEIENRWWRRIREMDGGSSQGIRNHSRNNRTIQPRPERGRRKGKSNNHGESQGYYCRSKARQKAMDGNRRYGRVSQESQSNKCSRNYTLQALARRQTQPFASQNYRLNSVCPHSKGKTHEARYAFAQGNSGRLRRHEPVQGMGPDKERRCGIKGRGIHRREVSQPNASGLRGIQPTTRK